MKQPKKKLAATWIREISREKFPRAATKDGAR
jgi:hypothetical protein